MTAKSHGSAPNAVPERRPDRRRILLNNSGTTSSYYAASAFSVACRNTFWREFPTYKKWR